MGCATNFCIGSTPLKLCIEYNYIQHENTSDKYMVLTQLAFIMLYWHHRGHVTGVSLASIISTWLSKSFEKTLAGLVNLEHDC